MNRFCDDWNGLRCAVASLAAVACAAPSALAQCNYEVTAIIQAPPCPIVGPPVTRGHGMNSLGHVCGSYAQCWVTADEAFYWTPETGFHMIPRLPGMLSSYATGINDHGIVCGYMTTGIDVGDRAWVYDTATGEMMFLEPLHGVGNSYANAINNSNVVVGSRSIGTSGANPFNAVIWKPFEKGAPVQDLGVMNGPSSSANAISETGVVVGWTGQSSSGVPFRRTLEGDIELLGRKYNVDFGFAYSSTSQAAGGSAVFFGTPSRAFAWHGNGDLVVVAPLSGFQASGSISMNEVGQMLVDSSNSATNRVPGVWQHGNLSALPVLMLPSPGVQLDRGRSINNAGQILLRGLHNGRNVAIVLSPVNQPLTDLNHDCATNTHDLLILLGQWGQIPASAGASGVPSADFNQDGVVDVRDLLILLSNWG